VTWPRYNTRTTRSKPWFRFLLLAVSAFLAVPIGCISDSNVITLTKILFGSLATGLISEETLVKLLLRRRKR